MGIKEISKRREEEQRIAALHAEVSQRLQNGLKVIDGRLAYNIETLTQARESMNQLLQALRRITPVNQGGWQKEAA